MDLRWTVLIVAWVLATVMVPAGLALSVAVAIWLAGHRSPYLRFFVITMLAAMLVTAVMGLGGYAVIHRQNGSGGEEHPASPTCSSLSCGGQHK